MSCECYFDKCKYHNTQNDPDEGPFCDEPECLATEQEIKIWTKERYSQELHRNEPR